MNRNLTRQRKHTFDNDNDHSFSQLSAHSADQRGPECVGRDFPGCQKETRSVQKKYSKCACKLGGIVRGDEGPIGEVAQVDCHGVKVVGVHGEEGQEEDGEVRGEVKGEVEQLREKRSSWMVWRWGDKRVNGLEALSHVGVMYQ